MIEFLNFDFDINSHGLLKSDKLYTELSSEHRNGCTLLHT